MLTLLPCRERSFAKLIVVPAFVLGCLPVLVFGQVADQLDLTTKAPSAEEAEGTLDEAVEMSTDSSPVSFVREIRPLLARHCFACHGPDERTGDLDLTSFRAATAIAESGVAAIVPGDAEASELLVRVRSHEDGFKMPDEGERLSEAEILLVERWIRSGAVYDEHFGFQPVREVVPPDVRGAIWVRNDVDRFVLRKLEAAGLQPAKEASWSTLIRRLFHDLTGLPPTDAEWKRWSDDVASDRDERLIETLLDSPQYGERWARHWLDVVRFAETNSFERDGVKANAHTYRDFVIQSLNRDQPFDQFLVEQLAGDELPEATASQLAATGFLRLGLWDDEPADPELHRYEQYDDIVRTVSEGMLGLTVGCARCHDHKIDPIPQTDYYEMLAFFRGLPPFAERHNTARFNQVDVSPVEVQTAYRKLSEELAKLEPKLRAIEQAGIGRMPAPFQRAAEGPRRERILRTLAKQLTRDEELAYRQLCESRDRLRRRKRQLPAREFVLGVTGTDPTPPETRLLERGNPEMPAAVVRPGFPELLGGGVAPSQDRPESGQSSGRRLALARWIATNPNGVVARVQVNRIWQHHFGRGLVASTNNFGQLGTPPSHPELLDWLGWPV